MKKLLFAFCALTLVMGCGGKSEKKGDNASGEIQVVTPEVIQEVNEIKETKGPYKVGDLYFEDGVIGAVFEATHGGLHGKIVSVDCEELQWCDDSLSEVQTYTDNLYDGALNTWELMNRYDADKYYAASWCVNYGDGWYLPAKNELENIYAYKDKINSTLEDYGFETINGSGIHWSSTERYNSYAWYVPMCNGSPFYNPKYINHYVRAVSAF